MSRSIGLDVHRDFCQVVIADGGRARSAGRIATSPEILELFAQSLAPTDRVVMEAVGRTTRLSPHALRRSFASWLVAEGEDPAYVMQQLGHTDPKMTLGLYAKALKSKRRRPRAQGVRAAGRALEPAANGHGMGTSGVELAAEPADTQAA